jgi:carbamoyltransferase
MSKIIAISPTYAHDAGAALIIDGEIKFALEEEKLTGIKSIYNWPIFPNLCVSSIEKNFGINFYNCDHIVSPRPTSVSALPEKYQNLEIERKFSTFSHHACHALGSYYTSGMDGKVISLSLDGAGSRSRSKIYLCEDGLVDLVHSSWRCETSSLANLWGFSTQRMGWKAMKDEGKLVGLAGHGKFKPKIYEYLNHCLSYENLKHNGTGWDSMFNFIANKLQQDKWFNDPEKKADFAATLEKFSEDQVFKLLFDMKKRFPEYNKLCLSGGLFANVKLNQFINECGLYDEIFIHQAMGDAGLFLGAGLLKAYELNEIKKPLKPTNVFWGESFSKEKWEIFLSAYPNIRSKPFDLQKVAELINDGKVVGVFQGRTEYGPRALGNRSIVVRATDSETHKKLNERLKRTEIMPFAPSVLSGYEEEIFDCKNSKYTAEFMTLCYNTKENWINKIPAVVHPIDKSARPQIVKRDANPFYYDLIEAYRKISGLPIVLNTSFNAHGEPINNHPNQVMKHLLDGSVDFIVTEDFILSL